MVSTMRSDLIDPVRLLKGIFMIVANVSDADPLILIVTLIHGGIPGILTLELELDALLEWDVLIVSLTSSLVSSVLSTASGLRLMHTCSMILKPSHTSETLHFDDFTQSSTSASLISGGGALDVWILLCLNPPM